ncbi:1825_t:CDS:2 [Scutellospora calospora]|uniref:1825_t:CDS:1 n=1 Tax=Scutellospora calospora TaxID=85575 RepID=A0ACA9JVH7_9GLOM|nr:1825_t:CDS:2 [Scutellospora calospora]
MPYTRSSLSAVTPLVHPTRAAVILRISLAVVVGLSKSVSLATGVDLAVVVGLGPAVVENIEKQLILQYYSYLLLVLPYTTTYDKTNIFQGENTQYRLEL